MTVSSLVCAAAVLTAIVTTSTRAQTAADPDCEKEIGRIERVVGHPAIAKSNGRDTARTTGKINCAGMGLYGGQYQCVEYVRRFYATVLGINTEYPAWPRPMDAKEFYGRYQELQLDRHPNHGGVPPKENDILVFAGPTHKSPGHVAIIKQVLLDQGKVIVVEQNWSRDIGEAALTLDHVNGQYDVARPAKSPSTQYTVLGWLRVPSASASHYTITDLSTLGSPLPFIQANGINDAGQVVGVGLTSTGLTHGLFWQPNMPPQDIGVLPGDLSLSRANAINGNQQITGLSYTSISGLSAIRAFLWSPTLGIQQLGTPDEGFNDSNASAINIVGQVVGSISVNPQDRGLHASLWSPDTGYIVEDLGVLAPYEASVATGINASGAVVGVNVFGNGHSQFGRAFIWNPSLGMRFLNDPPAPLTLGSRADAINSSGAVTGSALFATDVVQRGRAVLWRPDGSPIDLGSLLSDGTSAASAMNDASQVVGVSSVANGGIHAFIWSDATGMKDLNDLIDPSDPLKGKFELQWALGINNLGQIVGYGTTNDNSGPSTKAFLLTPLP